MVKGRNIKMKEQAIDNKELILALEELEKEKGIKKEYVLYIFLFLNRISSPKK